MSASFFHHWPQSMFEPFVITSPKTSRYNCIAWAFEDDTKFYWPDDTKLYFWPSHVPREVTVEAFVKLYESINYKTCDNGDFEDGYNKIAIYSNNGKPTHAARQVNEKSWTSKLGIHEDVAHSIEAMQNGSYGNVAVFMKRKKKP